MITFYVSGKWEEREQIRVIQNKLRKLGFVIIGDWTYDEEDHDGFPIENAVRDINAASNCDVYVGLFLRDNQYKGALIEMGAALSQDKDVCVIGHAVDECIFVNHPNVVRYDNEREFLSWVMEMVEEV